MGVRLLVTVVDRLPAELDAASRLVLVLLAEKANDQTGRVIAGRQDRGACDACGAAPGVCGPVACCSSCTHPSETPRDTLRRRSGLGEAGLTKALRRLADHGLEVRTPLAIDARGRPVFAVRGRSCDFQIPAALRERVDQSPGIGKVGPESSLPGTTVHPSERGWVDHSPPPSLSPSLPSAEGWTSVHPSELALTLATRVACSTQVAQTALDNLTAARNIDNLAGYVSRFTRDDVERWARGHQSPSSRAGGPAGRYCPEGAIVGVDGSCCDACAKAATPVRPPQVTASEVAS